MCVLLFYTFSGALFPAAYGKRKIFMAIHRGNELFGCELRKINNYCVRFNILKKYFLRWWTNILLLCSPQSKCLIADYRLCLPYTFSCQKNELFRIWAMLCIKRGSADHSSVLSGDENLWSGGREVLWEIYEKAWKRLTDLNDGWFKNLSYILSH